MMMASTKHMLLCDRLVLGVVMTVLLLENLFAAALIHQTGAPSVLGAFSSSVHHHHGNNRYTLPVNTRVGRHYSNLDYDGRQKKKSDGYCNNLLLASMVTSNADEPIIINEEQPSTGTSNESNSNSNNNTGSTAIILNMNARSVTPALISIASDIVGEENVFVTKTADDAMLAARTVVRGSHHHTHGGGITGESSHASVDMNKYSLVVPVGGDGTLSGWINTMVDEILLFHKLENESGPLLSVEEALQYLPTVGYIPMGTGNGLGYVIGCKTRKRDGIHGKLQRAKLVMERLKDVGDTIQEAQKKKKQEQQLKVDIAQALSGKCSIIEMPLMEVTHPTNSDEDDGNDTTTTARDIEDPSPSGCMTPEMKGDLCFFAGAGFDSLMLHDFQQIKAWSKSTTLYGPRALPSFVKDALSSVAGYCVALVTKTLPQTLRYGTHKIHVEVTTKDEDTLWVDHRRGDFSELAVSTQQREQTKQQVNGDQKVDHLIYSGTTGIIAAATTPYYGGGLRLFPYARLIPDKLQLRLGRISPLVGFFNIPKIFEGSYREKGERSFGCLDFIGKEFEVEVRKWESFFVVSYGS